MDFPTSAELFEIAVRKVIATNPKIAEDLARQSGTTVNSLLQAGGLMGSTLVGKIAEVAANSKLSTASGAALRELVWDWFSIVPIGANPAVVPIKLKPSGAKTGQVAAGTILTTAKGVQFTTIDGITWSNEATEKTVDCQAVLAGPSGNLITGSINAFKTAPTWDTAMTVTQPVWATGGSVAETDDELKKRASGFWAVARCGTIGAIEYGAKSVPGIKNALAIESPVMVGSYIIPSVKWVTLYVSDINGQANTVLLAAVTAELLNWRPCGVIPTVSAGTVVFQPINMTVSCESNADTIAVKAKAISVILAYMDNLIYEQKMDLGAIEAAVMKISGVSKTVPPVITIPTLDQIAGSGEIFRTSEDLIMIS